jgi:hypothetical protein
MGASVSPHPALPQEEEEAVIPGVARSWRSVLRCWSSCPTRGSWLGLGLHMLDTGQNFLLVSRQSNSNSEQVPMEEQRTL